MKIQRYKILKDDGKYRVFRETKTYWRTKIEKVDYFYELDKAKEFIKSLEENNGEFIYMTNWIDL